MGTEWPEGQVEKKEVPEYVLTITVHRHGPRPKDDALGLSPENRKTVFDRTYADYKGVPIDEKAKRRSVVSPKIRTKDTDEERQKAFMSQGASQVPVEEDARLSEGGMEYINSQVAQGKMDWFRDYYAGKRPTPESGSGKEAAANFASWILDTLKTARETGGKQEVDATTHAPLMAAFIFKLEDALGIGIVSDGPGDERRFDHDYLGKTAFPLMSSFNIVVTADKPDAFNLFIGGKNIEIPRSVIENLAGEKS